MKTKLILLAIATTFSFTSCNLLGDKDEDVLITRNDYFGTYNVSETCPQYNATYNMTIGAGPGGTDQILLQNYNERWDVSATVNGGSVTINTAEYELNQGVFITLSGSGTLVDGVLSISDSKNCSMTATKQ